MIQIKNTKDVVSNGIKVLIFGGAGVGKTYIIKTAPNPIIISTEKGLLSLKNFDIPYIEVSSYEDFKDAYEFVISSGEMKHFDTICLDSLTDIAETVLFEEKPKNKNLQKAYGDMQDLIKEKINQFKRIDGKNVYFSCHETSGLDGSGNPTIIKPMLPGRKLGDNLPHLFDEVFRASVAVTKEGQKQYYLQTFTDDYVRSKDRSGKLDPYEEANLTSIFNKIKGE